MGFKKICLVLIFVTVAMLLSPGNSIAEPLIPKINIGIDGSDNPDDVALSLQVLAMLTILTLAPGILILTTSFIRIIVVLSFIRSALATQQMPPNQVLIGLALFLTFFTMAPVWNDVNNNALQPYLNEELSLQDAYEEALFPVRDFMFSQTREKDLALFVKIADLPSPETRADIPNYVLLPAFAISELKTAFQIGFIIFIPFIVIDMVVASVLMSMGMMMLPPMMISLPFKLLLFVLVDGWNLIIESLLLSFR